MTNEKIVLATFGDGSFRWRRAAKRLIREADALEIFDASYSLNFKWLKKNDFEIAQFIKSCLDNGDSKGFGYWAWKPSVLSWLATNHPDATIVYIDAGFVIFDSVCSRAGFKAWLTLAENHGSLAFSLSSFRENEWTKLETLAVFDPKNLYGLTDQIQANLIILSPTQAKEFIPQFRNAVRLDDGFHLKGNTTDSRSINFVSHRHDQSIFSLLWKTNKFFTIPDQTDPSNHTGVAMAARHSSGFSFHSNSLVNRILVNLEKIISKLINRI